MLNLIIWDEENYSSQDEVDYDQIRKITALCLEESKYVTLNDSPWKGAIYKKQLQKELQPYRHNKFRVFNWFGYTQDCFPPKNRNPIKVSVYPVHEKTKEILLNHMTELFGSYHDGVPTLEDLCMFGERGITYGTVEHEYILCTIPQTEEHERLLKAAGTWRYCEDDDYRMNVFPWDAWDDALKRKSPNLRERVKMMNNRQTRFFIKVGVGVSLAFLLGAMLVSLLF